MDLLAVPFLRRLDDAFEFVFPPTLVRAFDVLAAVRGRRGGPHFARGLDPDRTLGNLAKLRSDRALREYLLNRSSLHEVRQIWWACTWTQARMNDLGGESAEYQRIREQLGKKPGMLKLARIGLRRMRLS